MVLGGVDRFVPGVGRGRPRQVAHRGTVAGGVLSIVRHEVEVICPADAIPDNLVASLASFDVGESIHISVSDTGTGMDEATRESTVGPLLRAARQISLALGWSGVEPD